ncbi:YheT family hydrolase [Salisaeta longa]|uniref:YheT family hydrolase n=1 Tax=Salisaeta longa TaxID=503170 RepID=UPI0003B31356|nr:alpha/beta fold hydrolase [Salisaeta longa]
MPVQPATYRPPLLLRGGHVQTIAASMLRRVTFAYGRAVRLATPDDDVLHAAWARAAGGGTRVAVLTHGLEGSMQRPYMRGMARALTRRGWDVLAWNMRGCGPTINRQVATYHSGKTEDLDCVVQHALDEGYERVVLIGFSMGGNLSLKYVGERGASLDARVAGAVAFSTPVDLAAASHRISHWTNWHYTRYFLRSLTETVRQKARQHPTAVSTAPLQTIRSLPDFDDAYTAPLNGYADADEYYAKASCKPFLADIARPALLVNAANDPFLPTACYPTALAREHPQLVLEVPREGGHVGFVQFNDAGEYWSEVRAAQFLSALE